MKCWDNITFKNNCTPNTHKSILMVHVGSSFIRYVMFIYSIIMPRHHNPKISNISLCLQIRSFCSLNHILNLFVVDVIKVLIKKLYRLIYYLKTSFINQSKSIATLLHFAICLISHNAYIAID